MLSAIFRHALARELALVITIKIIVIALAAVFIFGPGHRVQVNPASMYRHLIVSPER